jgi:glutathione peroxidase-family protein/uncharacterized membrane protein
LYRKRFNFKRYKMKATLIQTIFRILLGSFMLLAGIGHLTFQREEFLAQVPRWLPDSPAFMDFVVLASGAVEILLGLGMIFLVRNSHKVGIALAVFYILIFPGNISQYTNQISAFGLDTDQKRFIRLFFQPVLILWALWSTNGWKFLFKRKERESKTTIYDFSAKKLSGEEESLGKYKGKTIIVVNTASKCGLAPQFEGLEKLYQKYKDQGLVILGFPCSQFANQELDSSKEIGDFCQINYGVSFPMFDKVHVNGKDTHPVFSYLKGELGGLFGSGIKWNFTKFVIDKNGRPMKRFAPTTKPENMENFIRRIL